MELSVSNVFGRRGVPKDPSSPSGFTLLAVPGTDFFIEYSRRLDQTYQRSMRLAPIEFKSIVLPLSHVLYILDRELATWETILAFRASEYRNRVYLASLKAWRDDLLDRKAKAAQVLHKVRQMIAAGRIQNQFRQAISNPTYRLCQKRLLEEFESMGTL